MNTLDELIEEITVDAHGDDEQIWAFLQAFTDEVSVPCDGRVAGSPVKVTKFDFDGNERRGLTAACRGADGANHVVAAFELELLAGTTGARYVAAYRKWMGLKPSRPPAARTRKRTRIVATAIAPSGLIELAVLSVGRTTARGRILGSDRIVTLRARSLAGVAPGEIASVKPRKRPAGSGADVAGVIESVRLDVAALGLTPLRLEDRGVWEPAEEYWGEEGEPIEEWAKPLIARGPRPRFEMEQVLPGSKSDPDQPFSDPIGQAVDLTEAGDWKGAHKALMALCEADLRCLDAHAQLGNLVFDDRPGAAIRHYEAGLQIGTLSLGETFDGVLPWAMIDNRPLLRCLHGFGLCLWRLGRVTEAVRVFQRMLWLNPSDNQGARFLVADIRAGNAWRNE